MKNISTTVKTIVLLSALSVVLATLFNSRFNQPAQAASALNLAAPAVHVPRPVSAALHIPPSLAELPLAYRFQTTDSGELLISSDLREIFDFFLLAIADQPIDKVIQQLRDYISWQLTPPARDTALDILDRYLSMKRELMEFDALSASDQQQPQRVAEWVTRRNQLIHTAMGVEYYAAFFAQEHQHDYYQVEKRAIIQDDNLSAEQRQQALEQLQRRYPAIAALNRKTHSHLEASRQVQLLQDSGATAADIYHYRLTTFGAEAAMRLTELDKQQAQWQQRIKHWQQQRDQLLQTTGLSGDDRQAQIVRMTDQLFNPREQLRLSSYEDNSLR